MSLLPVFQYLQATTVGEAIRTSSYLFPAVETIHLLALSTLGGSIVIVDLRLCGGGMRQPVSEIASDARPWMIGSLIVMIATGLLLFMSEVLKCYESAAFRAKMVCLLLALIFTFTVRQGVTSAGSEVSPAWNRAVGFISLLLWSGVGLAGRGIGFL